MDCSNHPDFLFVSAIICRCFYNKPMLVSSASPFVSVVIPTYNRKDSLKITLDALAAQTYPSDNFEAIVVSDGSTDGTNEFLEKYAATAPYKVSPVVQKNSGPSRARNYGVELATGVVIVFIDDDVEPAPSFLASHAEHHTADEKIVVIGPMSADPKRSNAEPAWIAWEHAMLEKQYSNWRSGEWEGAGPNHFYSGNASVRREHIVAVGGFDESFKRQEDVELAVRMRNECGVHFIFDAEAIGIHRPHRTFKSWLNVATAYGALDVFRTQSKTGLSVAAVQYFQRNRLTKWLSRITLSCPSLASPLRTFLLGVVKISYKLGVNKVSIALLSVIYNLRYLESAQEAIGRTEMLRLIAATSKIRQTTSK
jgi:glycosyltransferase involved in cell wall biosynthesis